MATELGHLGHSSAGCILGFMFFLWRLQELLELRSQNSLRSLLAGFMFLTATIAAMRSIRGGIHAPTVLIVTPTAAWYNDPHG